MSLRVNSDANSLHIDIVCEVAKFLDNPEDYNELRAISLAKLSNCPPLVKKVFIQAATQGDIKILQSMIRRGVDDEWLKTAVDKILRRNYNAAALKFLIDNGVYTVQILNRALNEAARNGDLHMVEFLISKGADDLNSALYQSMAICAGFIDVPVSENGNLHIVKFLVSKGANNLNYGLETASKHGYLDIVKYLISVGASALNSALCEAAQGGRIDVMEYLISEGASDLNRALLAASDDLYLEYNLNAVNFLISKGADDLNFTLCKASGAGLLNIVEFMIWKGANDFNGALLSALESVDVSYNLDIVKFLVKKGANNLNAALDDVVDYDGKDKLDILKYLVKKGADNLNGVLNDVVVHYGGKDKLDIVKCLVEMGADELNVALDHALGGGEWDIVDFLIKNGAWTKRAARTKRRF